MVRSSNRPSDDHAEQDDDNINVPLANNDIQGNGEQVYEASGLEGAIGFSDPSLEQNNPQIEISNGTHHEDSAYYRRRHSSAELYRYDIPQSTYRRSDNMEIRGNDISHSGDGLQHNHHDILYTLPQNVPAETAMIGVELYIDFLRDEIRRHNLQEPRCLTSQNAINPLQR